MSFVYIDIHITKYIYLCMSHLKVYDNKNKRGSNYSEKGEWVGTDTFRKCTKISQRGKNGSKYWDEQWGKEEVICWVDSS